MKGQVKAGCECEIAPWMKSQFSSVIYWYSLWALVVYLNRKSSCYVQLPWLLSNLWSNWELRRTSESRFTALQLVASGCGNIYCWQFLPLIPLLICFIAINQIVLFAEGPGRMICGMRVKGFFTDLSWGSDAQSLSCKVTWPAILEDIVEELLHS